jgi:hypothetical protein
MKKSILAMSFVILTTMIVISSCGNNQKSAVPAAETTKEQYQCPMKCTEELFDKPGKCPVCEMELVKVTKS